MPTNFRQFSVALADFAERLVPEKANQFKRAVGLQLLAGVVQKTPVDTGRARANWQVSTGAPAGGLIEGVDPSGGEAIARGAAALAQVQPGETIYISNNLPYILPLENGHSRQAPAGMVALTLAEIQSQFGR